MRVDFGPVCFNILPLPLRPYRFYHFTNFTILPFYRLLVLPIFHARRFRPCLFLHFATLRPYSFYHFAILTNFPIIGRLVVLVSLFSLITLVIPAGISRLVSLRSLVGKAILAILAFLFNLVSLAFTSL